MSFAPFRTDTTLCGYPVSTCSKKLAIFACGCDTLSQPILAMFLCPKLARGSVGDQRTVGLP